MKKRPYILSIAGFDPTSGAGLLADIKTFEALKSYGLAICTANTIQTDVYFSKCHWTPKNEILEQLDVILNRFNITVVKIGIIENWKVLAEVIEILLKYKPTLKIVLDPILSASTKYVFQTIPETEKAFAKHQQEFDNILNRIHLITPNLDEIQQLYPFKNEKETINHIRLKTNLLVKGGHKTEQLGKDDLYMLNGKEFCLNPKLKSVYAKHGSGCVLSAAIASYLAQGSNLLKACYKGKRYTEKILSSNKTLLAYHKF